MVSNDSHFLAEVIEMTVKTYQLYMKLSISKSSSLITVFQIVFNNEFMDLS